MTETVLSALIAGLVAIVVAGIGLLGGWLQARETRRRNTAEHDQGREERERDRRAAEDYRAMLNGRLESIDENIRGSHRLLVDHIQDSEAHPRG